MPTYEYKCRDCGHQLEVVQSFTDDTLTRCPSCRKHALRKVFSPVGIAFKGSGFYKTDSRSSNGKSSATAGSSTEKSDKADKSSSSSEAKTSPSSSSDNGSSSSSSDKKSTSSSSDKKATTKK